MFNFIKKTFSGLHKTRKNIINTFSKIHGKKYLNQNELDELESVLFQSDLSYELTMEIINEFESKTLDDMETWEDKFVDLIKLKVAKENNNSDNAKIYLIIGVNGTGKTTTSAKICNYYKNKGFKSMLVGADTYRAAAVEQLKMWSKKLNVKFVSNESTKDPASIVYDAVTSGLKDDFDKIIIDTAGRLHNSVNLMQELEKVYRVSKKFNEKVKVVLVIDSNVGQNGMNQALEFSKFIPVDSLVLTKMDGTAKGGIAVSMVDKLNIPIDFIGMGEGVDDLVPFELETFLKGLISNEN
ncbi:signal recognition particle-docking protein FtsY [bacterium]|nr:MAG: signal recognition particle-docking protein FtsY [bacterium TMED6]RCL87437.1 MAG: signal recognition particle-docking protein FtsY [bacterium]|tara:strand:- start:7232 stop:8122 length:891 start_codon:yes stop_codon:yes gene_type:complete